MTWLLTGGAGYIGAHVLRSLQASGRGVLVVDDLSTGLESKIPAGVPLIRCDVRDRAGWLPWRWRPAPGLPRRSWVSSNPPRRTAELAR